MTSMHVDNARPFANQAEMEAATSNSAAVSPGRLHNHPGVAKGWCQIQADGTLSSPAYNIASITDTDTGNRTVVWDVDFSSGVYAALAASNDDSSRAITSGFDTFAVGSVRLLSRQHDDGAGAHQVGALVDIPQAVVAFGDH